MLGAGNFWACRHQAYLYAYPWWLHGRAAKLTHQKERRKVLGFTPRARHFHMTQERHKVTTAEVRAGGCSIRQSRRLLVYKYSAARLLAAVSCCIVPVESFRWVHPAARNHACINGHAISIPWVNHGLNRCLFVKRVDKGAARAILRAT